MEHKKYASPMTTHKNIQDLIKEGKVISKPDKNNSQKHQLIINDKNLFNRIKKYLSETERFIDESNVYLRRLFDKNLGHVQQLKENPDQTEESEFAQQSDFYLKLESNYKQTVNKILEDLFHILATSNLSEKDTELFHKKIIELKSKLAYHSWSPKIERSVLNAQFLGSKNYLRLVEKQGAIQSYLEDRGVKSKLLEPLKARKKKFEVGFFS